MASTRPIPAIVMNSPPPERRSNHPRRPPAHHSVSLLHSQPLGIRNQSDSSSDSSKQEQPCFGHTSPGTDSPSSLQPLGGRDGSGESSNAEKWFEESNNEVCDHSASFADNDPPFFMRNSSSSKTPPDFEQFRLRDVSNNHPLRTGLLQLGTDGGSAEEFRGVIDDLTVENKKLKRRLKRYEKLHDSHLKDEKLFEVRIHSLPAEKKRELEETLRKFASSLGTTAANAFPADGYSTLIPMLKSSKTAFSQTSFQHADSAYASMSASGQGSVAQSGNESKRKLTPTQYLAARRQNIHSYLHHIPEGLLPHESPAQMTERAKQKLVVRRLEQLFAGKGAVAGSSQQSIQQQEVSHSAAINDQSAIESSGQCIGLEGSREANIMDEETEDPMLLQQDPEKHPNQESNDNVRPKDVVSANIGSNDRTSASVSLEQRPTRPLDLDPYRAQVPAENIRYMRQMGFSPDPQADRTSEDSHGWIYLNFLINMAQLHTINVTSEYVRKALSEYSTKFDISHDGRKVRWKGGSSLTRTSSNGGGSPHERISDNVPNGESPRKRRKLTHKDNEQSSMAVDTQRVGSALRQLRTENSRHSYTSMFFHKDSTDESDDSSSEEEDGSVYLPLPVPVVGTSSGMNSSGVRTCTGVIAGTIKNKQKHNDGPIIFYNNARFCTDLSGDRKPDGNYNAPAYAPVTNIPIGVRQNTAVRTLEKRGPLAHAYELPKPMNPDDDPVADGMELSFPPVSPAKVGSSEEPKTIDLEVTGIGGVWPVDNFAISIESRHALIDQRDAPGVAALPPRFAHFFPRPASKPKSTDFSHKQIVSSKIQVLPPSQLPPAISFIADDNSTDEDDSDAIDDDEESDTPESAGAPPPCAALQPVDIPYVVSDSEDEGDDEDEYEDESDEEVDFLAAARQLDPEAVRQKEREYDAIMAERLAEEIHAGSSAATAGGGSGFASPASRVGKDERLRAIRAHMRRGSRCVGKKAGMADLGIQDYSSSEDESDDDDDEMSVRS